MNSKARDSRYRFAGSALLLSAWLAGSCDDVSVSYVDPMSWAFTVDAGSPPNSGGDGDVPTNPCAICLAQQVREAAPECVEISVPCMDDSGCEDLLGCVLDRGCLAVPMEQTVGCAQPCAAAGAVNSAVHPAVVLGFPLFDCAQIACADACPNLP